MATDHGLTVSGIITTYNRPAFLSGAIESALAQTQPLAELIVVDDCSPRDVASVLAPFGERVRYVRLARNQGPSGARNAGVAAAGGDVIAFLDDDDVWLPEKLERQVAQLAEGCGASLCGLQLASGGQTIVARAERICPDDLRWGNPFCGTTGLVARRALLLEEPFDESLRWAEDWELYLRLAQRQPLGYVDAALFERRHGDHEGLTQAHTQQPLEKLLRTADAATKHRAWLGEWAYRNAVARALLREVSKRPDKHRQIMAALRRAGPIATVATLALMFRRSPRHSHWIPSRADRIT